MAKSFKKEKKPLVQSKVEDFVIVTHAIDSERAKEYESLLVFPENSIPYDIIDDLIEFAEKNKIVIIGGVVSSSGFR